jgi:chemotaxis protein methyltransferase CheR
VTSAGLEDEEAAYIAGILLQETGVRLPLSKKTMIQARLLRRMQRLGLSCFGDYIHYLRHSPERLEEREALVDILTTHKTDFFRERHHFDFLISTGLANLPRPRSQRPWQAWSAGCSSGEEAWSLGMVLAEYFNDRPWWFQIFASDVSPMVLNKARRAVYPHIAAEGVAQPYRERYLMTGHGRQAGNVRIIPELREKILFRQENLLDPEAGGNESFDLLFCRNVMIYFDRDATTQLVRRLARRITPGGYLFIGHSETIDGIETLGLRLIAPTIYQKM